MASNFQVWIDSATDDNTMSSADLSSDSQRANGFQPSQPASSKRVNSMLRQSSLVSAALMDIIDPTGTTTLRSSKSDVETLMTNYFESISSNIVTVTFTDSQGGTRSLQADKLFGAVVNDYNAGKTIIAKYSIYENFVLVGIEKVAGQIGKLYFAYIDDNVIKVIDFDSYGGEIYTHNMNFTLPNTISYQYSGQTYIETGSLIIPLNGNKYRLTQLQVLNMDPDYVAGKSELYVFNATGTTGYLLGQAKSCTITNGSASIAVTFANGTTEFDESTNVQIVAYYSEK